MDKIYKLKHLYLLLFFLVCSLPAFCIDAYFNHAVFLDPDKGTYVETHMLFRGESLRFVNVGNGYQARVELTYIFEQGENVKAFSKNLIKGPITTDSASAVVDFLDLQRFALPAGVYNLSIKLRDANNPSDTGAILHQITVNEPGEQAFFGSIIYLDTIYPASNEQSALSRGNMAMLPRISGYQGPDANKLRIYTELYQTDIALGGSDDYLLTLDLVDVKTGKPLGDYRKMQRLKGNDVQPVVQIWDIGALPTGQYMVQLEARNRFNQVLASANIGMQRQTIAAKADSFKLADLNATFVGKINGEKQLRDYVYCMRYQAGTFEEKFIEENWERGDTVELKRFMYNFWRDRNPLDPELAWRRYERQIKYVEDEFGLGSRRRHACATDRGRVYLHYGKPDTRVQQQREPNALPYEIWHYYALPEKQDAKFAFMDPSAVTNDYVLINSNVPGEIVDYAWYYRLSTYQVDPSGNDEPMMENRVSDPNNLRGMQMNTVASQALDFWNNPR
jgi:GWxTD domain-containing protein